jgi:translation initiation factor 2-alpha kinase 4
LCAGKRKLGKIETDLDRIHSLRHPHLLSLLGYRIVRHNPPFFPQNPFATRATRSGEGWSLFIIASPLRSNSLEDLLATVGELRTDRALAYFTQLVAALEYLHSQNVVHRGIKLRNIFVTNEKSKATAAGDQAGVKLAGAGWYRRLIDLNKAEAWVIQPQDEELPESW